MDEKTMLDKAAVAVGRGWRQRQIWQMPSKRQLAGP